MLFYFRFVLFCYFFRFPCSVLTLECVCVFWYIVSLFECLLCALFFLFLQIRQKSTVNSTQFLVCLCVCLFCLYSHKLYFAQYDIQLYAIDVFTLLSILLIHERHDFLLYIFWVYFILLCWEMVNLLVAIQFSLDRFLPLLPFSFPACLSLSLSLAVSNLFLFLYVYYFCF